MFGLLPVLLPLLTFVDARNITSYANVFVDPNFLASKNGWNAQSTDAQQAIIAGAQMLSAPGPWGVANKTVLPPSGNRRDYLSWAPYWWPDCSKAGNKTALTPEQMYDQCVYVSRDGQFNPDIRSIGNIDDINNMADAIFYSSIAWVATGDSSYSSNIARFVNAWFVDSDTAQTPNLNFAQVIRGVGQNKGAHTGLLDLKCMTKIINGVLVLKLGKAPEWTDAVDTGFKGWVNAYMPWIQNNTLAVQERDSTNNHGSFFYNQLVALYLLLDDPTSAKAALDAYFNGIFLGQINANGEQPLEAERTHPIHYRAYNLAAIFTNARMADYLGVSYWNQTTKAGGTIKAAVDYAMVQNPAPSNEQDAVQEMYQIVAAASTVYGDKDGKYKAFLSSVDPSEAFFLWDFHATVNSTSTSSGGKGGSKGGAPSTSKTPSDHSGASATTTTGSQLGSAIVGLLALGVILSLA